MKIKTAIFDVATVGTPMVDIPVRVQEETISQSVLSELRVGSANIVDDERFSAYCKMLNPSPDVFVAGGSAANTAVIASQLGSRAVNIGRVGNDSQGSFFEEELRNHSVVPSLTWVPTGRTGAILALISPNSERTFCVNPGVNKEFSSVDVNSRIIRGANWTLIQGHLFRYGDKAKESISHIIDLSRHGGRSVAISLGSDVVVAEHRDSFLGACSRVDAIFGNIEEARALTGQEALDDVVRALSGHVPNFVITLGSSGAIAKWDGQEHFISGLSVIAIDSTGAGDAFAGAVLHGLARELPFRDSLEGANRIAAKVVSQLGARLDITDSEIRQLYLNS